MIVGSGNLPDGLACPVQSSDEFSNYSDLSIQQSSVLEVGDALTTNILPGQPVVRLVNYFFGVQSPLASISCLSAISQAKERNYQNVTLTIDTNFPAFLIVFPHHYFT